MMFKNSMKGDGALSLVKLLCEACWGEKGIIAIESLILPDGRFENIFCYYRNIATILLRRRIKSALN